MNDKATLEKSDLVLSRASKTLLVADTLADEGIQFLKRQTGIKTDVRAGLSEDELCQVIADYDAVIVRSATKITRKILDASTHLQVIGRAGIGVDNIDIDHATERGVVVLNTPDANATTTAELTIAHLLSLSRHLPSADRSVRAGEWRPTSFIGTELADKTIGIVGFGTIGRMVASRCIGLNMHVVAYDPFVTEEIFEDHSIKSVELDELLKYADYVSLHCPVTDKTRGFINQKRLALMKPSARLINCARGDLIDEEALHDALANGRLAGAALDVFLCEPPKDSPLLSLGNVVFTPHLGASTREAQSAVGVAIASQVVSFLNTGSAIGAINLPRIAIEDLPKIKPYINLAQRLGKLLASLSEQPPNVIEVTLMGRAIEFDPHLIAVEVLVGLLGHVLSVPVNQVNAPRLAHRQGISVMESRSDQVQEYSTLIQVTAKTHEAQITLKGTLFGEGKPRIVQIDEYEVEVVPEGTLLFTRHEDRPGVVGAIGAILGAAKVNISRMQIGVSASNSLSIGILGISTPLDQNTLDQIKEIPAIQRLYQLTL